MQSRNENDSDTHQDDYHLLESPSDKASSSSTTGNSAFILQSLPPQESKQSISPILNNLSAEQALLDPHYFFKRCSMVFFSVMLIGVCALVGDSVSERFYRNKNGWGIGAAVGVALLILYKKCFLDRTSEPGEVTENEDNLHDHTHPRNSMRNHSRV